MDTGISANNSVSGVSKAMLIVLLDNRNINLLTPFNAPI